MKRSVERIILDVQDTNELVSVEMKQGDTARSIEISLADGGYPYEMTDGCYAVFTATKPDGNTLFNHCRIENGTIIYDVTQQTTAAAGRIIAEIKVYGPDDHILTSAHFRIFVNSAVLHEEDVESAPEFSALGHLISAATAVLDGTGEAIENANQAADDANAAAAAANGAADTVVGRTEEYVSSIRQEAEAVKNASEDAVRAASAAMAADESAGNSASLALRTLSEVNNAGENILVRVNGAGETVVSLIDQEAEPVLEAAEKAKQEATAARTYAMQASGAQRASESSRDAAKVYRNEAYQALSAAENAANRAQESVAGGQYIFFEIGSNGHVYMEKSDEATNDFNLEEGRLVFYG